MVSLYGCNALHFAAMEGKHLCIVKLITYGADISCITSVSKRSAIHYTATRGSLEVMQVILSIAHANGNILKQRQIIEAIKAVIDLPDVDVRFITL